MRFCVKCRGKTDRERGVKIHYFPKNNIIRKKWLEYCKKKEVHKTDALCSRNFSDGYKSALSIPDIDVAVSGSLVINHWIFTFVLYIYNKFCLLLKSL